MTASKRHVMAPNLHLTAGEWRTIAAALPLHRTGRPPADDRQLMAAFCYCRATGVAFECMPTSFTVKASALRVRVQRWQAAGVLARIEAAAQPAIARMRAEYDDLLHALSVGKQSVSGAATDILPRWTHVRGQWGRTVVR